MVGNTRHSFTILPFSVNVLFLKRPASNNAKEQKRCIFRQKLYMLEESVLHDVGKTFSGQSKCKGQKLLIQPLL